MVARGEVWWAEAPDSERRPYLVLTRQEAVPVLNAVLAVPATRHIRPIATHVVLDRRDGMPLDCALSFDNVLTLPKVFFRERITRLSPERMNEACRALSVASGCI